MTKQAVNKLKQKLKTLALVKRLLKLYKREKINNT